MHAECDGGDDATNTRGRAGAHALHRLRPLMPAGGRRGGLLAQREALMERQLDPRRAQSPDARGERPAAARPAWDNDFADAGGWDGGQQPAPVPAREQHIGGSGGSREPPGPLSLTPWASSYAPPYRLYGVF